MSANVETMFYTSNEENGRFVPWHGLGTPVENAPTSADALRLAGLDWEVIQKPVLVEGNEVPNYRANVRDTDNSVLGIVSDRYKIVQNKSAFAFTDDLVGGDVRYETAGSLFGGKKIWLLAKMPQTTILGDAVDPYICFTNTHDGSGAIKVCMSPIRVVCSNTLNIALNSAKRSWSCKHMGNIEYKLEEAKMTLGLANSYMTELAKKADELANSKIDYAEINKIFDEIFPVNDDDTDRKKANVKKAKEDFMVCYFMPDIKKFQGTKWGVINAASDFVTHVAPARLTKNYQENNFNRILDGHAIMDAFVSKVCG